MRIALIAMSGIRACDPELLRLGLTLPGFVERSKTIASLPSLGLLTLAGMTPEEHVCEYFEIKPADIVSESRLKKFATPRHIAQYLCRQLTEFSYPEIGQRFGGRDHTSVMHAVRKIEKDLERDSNMKNIISYLIRRIRES